MRIHDICARCQWCFGIVVWAGVAALLGLLSGGLFGLLYGSLLATGSGELSLAWTLAGRGAFAGIGTGVILGIVARMTKGEEEPASPAFDPEPADHRPSANGRLPLPAAQGSKPGIKSG